MTRLISKIVIVGNGEDWQKEKIISYCKRADFIIAADNGLALLHQYNITPDLIIGDLDSVSPSLLQQFPGTPVEKFPAKKDYSDLELSIKKAIGLNPKEIILLAVNGNYFDHSFAAIVNLFRYNIPEIEMKIINSNSLIFPIFKKTILQQFKDRRFSLFPLSAVHNFSMQGAQYSFPKKDLEVTDYSLSNVITEAKLEINLDEGILFCILFDEGVS